MSGKSEVLAANVRENHQRDYPTISLPDYFEIFVSSQICKHRQLSEDEIERAIVDGADDGGIDSIFIFVNGRIIEEDYDLGSLPKDNIKIELIFIQSKWKDSLEESVILHQSQCFDRLLGESADKYISNYNSAVFSAFKRIRNLLSILNKYLPEIHVKVYYAIRGEKVPNNKISDNSKSVVDVIQSRISLAEVDFIFLNADSLIDLIRERPRDTIELVASQPPMTSSDGSGYICFVKIGDFYNFISKDGALRADIFEANVRDYQGNNEVNSEIRNTLIESGGVDFWWFNNGITIIAENAAPLGTRLSLTRPSIVNGLQTSNEIYEYFSSRGEESDNRNVLVRVIKTDSSDVADKVIKSTNRQTSIPYAYLRATEAIHRNIDEYLSANSVYYERRKNYYKNMGKGRQSIVSIGELAQAVSASVLARPNDARARPSTLLKKDDDYGKIFSEEYPLDLYLAAALLYKRVTEFLQPIEIGWRDKNNVRFQLMMVLAFRKVRTDPIDPDKFSKAKFSELKDEEIKSAFDLVWSKYAELGATDAIAKGTDFARQVRDTVVAEL